METIIIVLLWAFMGLLCVAQNENQINTMTLENALIAYLILMVFGPFFVIINVLEIILTWLGWEDGNDDGHGV